MYFIAGAVVNDKILTVVCACTTSNSFLFGVVFYMFYTYTKYIPILNPLLAGAVYFIADTYEDKGCHTFICHD